MARNSSGVVVAGLTAGALAVVGFLAYQASAANDKPVRPAHASSSPSAQPSGKGKDDKAKGPETDKAAPPAGSGTGKRVVYALGQKRVWLVGADEKTARSFAVAPSSVSPAPGTYSVTSRSPTGTGSDGVPIEHVVRFGRDATGVVFGFSAAVDGSSPDPSSPKKTGAIRETPADGRAMWEFATRDTKIVVVR
ncbi:hypothetical protein [Streptomyces orinoci]|uniref:Secreted protein n=1 Tax=Streptomyces orinoci TaxID=67339 RepID=A0ABV3JXY7_STRON|nr:hypothetical protein [Streptomyces orinoci]